MYTGNESMSQLVFNKTELSHSLSLSHFCVDLQFFMADDAKFFRVDASKKLLGQICSLFGLQDCFWPINYASFFAAGLLIGL